MKRTGAILLAALVALLLARAQADDKTTAKDDKRAEDVKKLDQSLSDAIMKGDTKMLDRHTAADYMVIDPSGTVWDKKKNLEYLGSGNVKFDSIKDSDVKVHFYGDAAVITGLAEVKGKSKTHDLNGEYRWSRVYIERDGRWQCVMEQLTNVLKEKK